MGRMLTSLRAAQTASATSSSRARSRRRRDPRRRRRASRSARLSRRKRTRATPARAEPGDAAAGSGRRYRGSSTNTGYSRPAPRRAASSAGLSCTRSPFRNHTIAAVGASIAGVGWRAAAAAVAGALGIGEFRRRRNGERGCWPLMEEWAAEV